MVYSKQLREKKFLKFVELVTKGETKKRIMNTLRIAYNTYQDWSQIHQNKTPFLTQKRIAGPKRKTTPEDDNVIKEVVLKNQWLSLNQMKSLPEITQNQRISSVSDTTLKRRLKEKGVIQRKASIKTKLKQQHIERRLRYATEFKDWTFEDWCRVIFIDEFSCETGNPGKPMVWRTNGTRFDTNNIAEHSRNTRSVFSFIVCFSFRGLGPIKRIQRLNSETYIEYLEEVLNYMHKEFDDGNCLILHDNHPVHTSRKVKTWISNNIGSYEDFFISHPSLSPDLNPIENVGAILKRAVRKVKPIILTPERLWEAIEEQYHRLSQNKQYFINLINSMPKRLNDVILRQGHHTKY